MKRNKVLILTQFYSPEPNFITQDVAGAVSPNASVTVITAHPNYPRKWFYPGATWWRPTKSIENGVTVWRVPMVPDHSTSVLRRTMSYLSFLFSAGVVAPLVGGRVDVVWVYQTPFTTALAALWFKWFWRARIVYTVADLWPESIVASGLTRDSWFVRWLFWLRRRINQYADHIVCSTQGTARQLEREGVSGNRLSFVPVWVETAKLSSNGTLAPSTHTVGARRIVYAGNMGPAQCLDTVIAAALELERLGVDVHFDFYGSGSHEEALRSLVTTLGVRTVHFHGRVAPADALRQSAAAFAQIVLLRREPMFSMTLPSKLFSCLSAGAPLLYALEGEAERIAADSGGGLPFTADDPKSLVQAITELISMPVDERERMRRSMVAYYQRNFALDQLLAAYRLVLLGTQ